jgi:hypothetical protein
VAEFGADGKLRGIERYSERASVELRSALAATWRMTWNGAPASESRATP